jgi:type IX secretion system PorP/SprF family membrane protein
LKYISTFFILFLFLAKANCQIRAAQFYSVPLLYNPASTGRFDKSYRAGVLIRNEVNAQKKDFKQSVLYFDTKILRNKLPENDCLALGIVGMSENGISEGIKNSYLSISVGYQKALDEQGKHQIGIGFQNTFSRKTITKPEYVFEDDLFKYLNYGYSNLNVFEFQNADFSFIDFNAGVIFQGAINNNNLYSIGLSVNHITEPKILFSGGTFILPRQFFGHFSFQKEFKNSNKIFSSFLIGNSNNSINDIITGLTYDYKITKGTSLLIGSFFRKNLISGNSVIPNLGISSIDFILNFSYDVNVSTIVKQRGASEVSLKYAIAKTRNQFFEKRFIAF